MIRSLTIQISSTRGIGPLGELEVLFSRWDQIGTASERPEFQYRINADSRQIGDAAVLAYGHDVRLGSGEQPDHARAMVVLLDYLRADAEKWGEAPTSAALTRVEWTFNEKTAEWAHELSEELALARDELSTEPDEEAATDQEALDTVAHMMSGNEWTADLAEKIAAVVRGTGRKIDDVESVPAPALYGNVHDENEGR